MVNPARVVILFAAWLLPAFIAHGQDQTARQSRTGAFNCGVIDVVLVSDIAIGRDEAGVIEARNELLGYVAAVQNYFQGFNKAITFRVREVFAPATDNPFPPGNDNVKTLADVNDYMKAWLLEKGFDDRSFDLRIAIMGYNYKSGVENYAGYYLGEPFSMGSAMVKRQGTPNQTIALLAHELGHAFGAGHDPENGTNIMSPNATAAGGSWSQASKDAINERLKSKEMVEWVGPCQVFGFDGIENGTNVDLTWSTNFEVNVSSYVLYEDGVIINTIPAKGTPTEEAVYKHTVTNVKPGYKVYWLDQISRFDQLLDRRTVVIGEKNEAFIAWPNPFVDTLRVAGYTDTDRIAVYNSLGSEVMVLRGIAGIGGFDTSQWPAGLYFVRRGKDTVKVLKK